MTASSIVTGVGHLVIGCAIAVMCALVVERAPRIYRWLRSVRLMARNIHDEREGDDLRCVHCNMRATLAFDETDRLIIVCRNKRCQYVETV